MAFANRLSERMEELRFPSVRTPNEDGSYNTYASPPRADSSFFATFQQPSADSRGSLQRRFTTDSSKVSAAFGQGYHSLITSSNPNQIQLDQIRAERRKAEAQLKQLDEQQKMLEGSASSAFAGMSLAPKRISLNGPVSEPTTPPEYANSSYSKRYSHNRMSISNMTSPPPGLNNRYSQSSIHITSPVGSQYNSNGTYAQTPKSPAKSMPTSRRGSDEDESYADELPAMRSVV